MALHFTPAKIKSHYTESTHLSKKQQESLKPTAFRLFNGEATTSTATITLTIDIAVFYIRIISSHGVITMINVIKSIPCNYHVPVILTPLFCSQVTEASLPPD